MQPLVLFGRYFLTLALIYFSVWVAASTEVTPLLVWKHQSGYIKLLACWLSIQTCRIDHVLRFSLRWGCFQTSSYFMYISGALQLLTETIFTEALFFTEVGRLRKCFSSPGLRTLFLAQIDTRLSCRNSPVQHSNPANDVKTSIFRACLLQKSVSSIIKTTKNCSRLLDANDRHWWKLAHNH